MLYNVERMTDSFTPGKTDADTRECINSVQGAPIVNIEPEGSNSTIVAPHRPTI